MAFLSNFLQIGSKSRVSITLLHYVSPTVQWKVLAHTSFTATSQIVPDNNLNSGGMITRSPSILAIVVVVNVVVINIGCWVFV